MPLVVSSLHELVDLGFKRISLTCGVFDGVHRGHQALIAKARSCASQLQARTVALTFFPHPAQVLAPSKAPSLLLSPEHKRIVLGDYGVEAVVVLPFTRELAATSAEDFLQHLTASGLEVVAITVGQHWRFGFKAQGSVETIRQHFADHPTEIHGIQELPDGDTKVSSTRIRNALRKGELQAVQQMLGRPYSILGRIEHGKGIGGSELHYPTANVHADNEVFPPSGIYASICKLRPDLGSKDPVRELEGILYLGNSPTFVENAPAKPYVEMHIFDFNQDIYGRLLEVEFIEYIRADAKYDSVDELVRQIAIDVEYARQIHARRRQETGPRED